MKTIGKLATLALALTGIVHAADSKVSVDQSLPTYQTVSGITGNLNSVGSDTLNNLMTLWAEKFSAKYPSVKIGIEGKGSGTAPTALISGTSQLGPMSRPMKREEIDNFKKQFGYEPTEIKVAIDALAVFTHKDNPVSGLSMKQIDGIFSSTCKRGGSDLAQWDQLPGAEAWQGHNISMYGRNSASGTYGFFKEHALKKGDFKSSVKEQPGSSAVVQGVASDINGIGYSGIGYVTSGVKALPISKKEGAPAVAPSYDNCLNGSYPMARYLVIYINKKPNEAPDALTKEFVKFVLSKEGQEVVVKDGYFPLPAKVEQEVMKSLE